MRSLISFLSIAIFLLTTLAWAADPEMDAIQREIQDVQAEIVKVNQETQGKPNTGKMLKLIQRLQELEARKVELAAKKDPGSVTFQERDRILNGYIFSGLRFLQEGYPERALREMQKAWDLSDHPLDRADVAVHLSGLYLRDLHHLARAIEYGRVVLDIRKYPINRDIDRFESEVKASGDDVSGLVKIARKIVTEDPLTSEIYLSAFLNFKVPLSATARDKAYRLHTLLRKYASIRSGMDLRIYQDLADAYELMGKSFESEAYLQDSQEIQKEVADRLKRATKQDTDKIIEEVKRYTGKSWTRQEVDEFLPNLMDRKFTQDVFLAQRWIARGRYLSAKGKGEEAKQTFASARNLLDSAARLLHELKEPFQRTISLDMGESLLAEAERDLPRALKWARQQLQDLETYNTRTKTTRVTYAEIYANRRIGTLYLRSGQVDEALAQMLKVESLYKRAEQEAQTEGYNIVFLHDKWEAYRDIGGCYLRKAESKKDPAALDHAESYLRRGVELVDQTYRGASRRSLEDEFPLRQTSSLSGLRDPPDGTGKGGGSIPLRGARKIPGLD
ncbi:MAG: hypothetical protein HYU64_15350 [Armatimonadetes bacterium]|nr:hypothetical protein [Armatimonadota bacterium]